MIDAAKYCDLVLLMVDGAYGFEMETFEFLNILQVGTLNQAFAADVVSHSQSLLACSRGSSELQASFASLCMTSAEQALKASASPLCRVARCLYGCKFATHVFLCCWYAAGLGRSRNFFCWASSDALQHTHHLHLPPAETARPMHAHNWHC